jgi:hypothetical protein
VLFNKDMPFFLPAVVLGTILLPAPPSPRPEMPVTHLESRRQRARAVYVGRVSAIRRLGGLDGLSGEKQGRMEATIGVGKTLRAPAGTVAPAEARIQFDSRAPEPDGDGFHALAAGEGVLVFADGFEPAYPLELLHGPRPVVAAQVKALRDYVAAMDAGTMRLHGLTPATRTSQVRLYDDALAALAK